ncbi:MAG: beta-N-acetylhexosaminidase [Gammaproteobacteria bacterium]|jgi:beta-N-acetylhexosaminidase
MTGPLICDIAGLELDNSDRSRLQNSLVGGVILFSRNYESPQQLKRLTAELHDLRKQPLLISVDHEGGRVQRFRDGLQIIPPMRQIGNYYQKNPQAALEFSTLTGWLMATELLAYGVDLSFAPILDVGDAVSDVIGDRAFHEDPEIISQLTKSWVAGMNEAGMAAVGKHFPGHGSVKGDSHHLIPVDDRPIEKIKARDLIPFKALCAHQIQGIMMAHVIYSRVDEQPAGYSSIWIKNYLRDALGFRGLVFSDDLSMRGAESAGGFAERARLSLSAGCDVLLVCNNPDGVDEVLDALDGYKNDALQARWNSFNKCQRKFDESVFQREKWLSAVLKLERFKQSFSD